MNREDALRRKRSPFIARHFIVWLLFLAPTLVGSARAATLFVTNEREGSVMAIDTTTRTIRHRTVAGPRARGIVFSPDRTKLYVAVSHFKGKPWTTTDD